MKVQVSTGFRPLRLSAIEAPLLPYTYNRSGYNVCLIFYADSRFLGHDQGVHKEITIPINCVAEVLLGLGFRPGDSLTNPNIKMSTTDIMSYCDSAHRSKCSLSSTQCEGNYRLIGAHRRPIAQSTAGVPLL